MTFDSGFGWWRIGRNFILSKLVRCRAEQDWHPSSTTIFTYRIVAELANGRTCELKLGEKRGAAKYLAAMLDRRAGAPPAPSR